jgi:hypothetical protein
VIGRAVVVAGLAAASVASAEAPGARPAPAAAAPAGATNEPPDSAAADTADANLESTATRRGMTLAAALGGGFIAGFGIDNSVGRGGAVAFRIGRVATPRTVITLELDIAVLLHKRSDMSPVDANSNAELFAGAQYFVSSGLSLRLGGGFGAYTARGIVDQTMPMKTRDDTTIGPAVLGGIGVELARIKWAVIGLEATTTAMINSGVLLGSSLKLGLSIE